MEGLKNRKHFALVISLLLILSVCMVSTIKAAETASVSMAPMKPEFLDVMSRRVLSVQPQEADVYSLGLIPSPLDLSHLKGQQVSEGPQLLGFTVSYDLRTMGKLTPVRDQGTCGDCWAFATYSSLESILMPSEVWNFSENNLKNTHGFDWGHCDGGNAYISTAYLARWGGPVSESDDPYNVSSNISPSGLADKKHIQDVPILPDRAGSLDNDNIKQAVMTYGAVYTTMYWGNSYYNAVNRAYLYNGTNSSNHAVAIVGWNDDYDKNRFSSIPPGNGAFIIRNSWGPAFGESGYFYVSYYDSNIGAENFVFDGAESTGNYSRIYQYDPFGWVSSLGYSSNTAWFSNIFTAAANEQIGAVSFYAASLNSTYELYIYTSATAGPRSGSLTGSKTGTMTSPGYHTISLDSTVPVTAGQKFSVVVKLTTPGYNYPIPMEYPYASYSSAATANSGESYMSSNGVSWQDIAVSYPGANACLKAFATANPVAQPNISVSPASYDFLDIDVGSTSGPQEFTVSNTGTADLVVSSIGFTGGDSAMFSVSSGGSNPCPDLAPTVAPGNNCTVNARFSPFSEGGKSTTLRIISNAPGGTTDLLLNGTGTVVPVFTDVPGSFWAVDYIDALYNNGITTGCTVSPLNYCPSSDVTRQAMAPFIIRALYGENFTYPGTPYFTDVPDTHQFFKYIQKMRELNITTGCTATEYCPTNNITRQAMAAFIIRALYGESFTYTLTPPYFTDVPDTNQFYKYIQKMKDEGITTGCSAAEYCPANLVNRASMAAFLGRAFLGMP